MVVGLSQVRDALADIVLWDVLMPKTDGLEMLQRIKEMQPRCGMLMLAGVNSQHPAKKALNFATFDFIGKPFGVVELRQKVIRAFEQVAAKSTAHG